MKPLIYTSNPRPEIAPLVPSEAKFILDIGCGEGAFGALLKKERPGVQVWGIEVSAEYAASAAVVLDRVLVEDARDALRALPNAAFDAIVCNDFLEHLADPYAFLRSLRPKLSQSGVVIASIPNVRYLYALRDFLVTKRWKYTDTGIMDRTHLRFFARDDVHSLFEDAGFEIIDLKGINAIDPRTTSFLRTIQFHFLNTVTFGYLADTRFVQFVCVARLPVGAVNDAAS